MLGILNKQIKRNRVSHAYLFLGSKYQDKLRYVLEFAQQLKISPEDLIIIDHPAEKTIKIEEIKEIQHVLNLKPYQSQYKLVVINNAEKMTLEAANSLLKTLEEPAGRSILVLISSSEDSLLSTIVSRCQKIRLNQAEAELNLNNEYPLAEIKDLDLKEKFDLAHKLSKEENLEETFDCWLLEAKNVLRSHSLEKREKIKKILNFLIWAYSLLKTNTNRRLILENLFLELE